MDDKVMTPTEFVLWLNGATSMVDGPPSAEQWAKMQEKLHPIIAKMMTDKLLDKADEQVKMKEMYYKIEQERMMLNKKLMEQLRNQQPIYTTAATSIAPMWVQDQTTGVNPAFTVNSGTPSMDELIANRAGYTATTIW